MSDANDLDNNTNNISVDENAFESFQNSTIGDESEYITLADILDDEVKQPTEMPAAFDDFLYENDEASQEFQTHLNDVVNNQLAEAESPSNNYNSMAFDSQQPPTGMEMKPSQKRTRRQRRAPKIATSECNEIESPDLGRTRKSKRERKPRVIPNTVTPSELDDSAVVTNALRKSTYQESKRGRKSKVVSDTVMPLELQKEYSEDVMKDVTKDTDSKLANGSVHKPTSNKKRGRKPKKLSDKTENSNFEQEGDDICLSKLKEQMSSSSQENQTELMSNKPILSDFEIDIENVITQTTNVVVESVETAYKPLQLKDIGIEDNTDNKTLLEPKCEEIINSTEISSHDNNGLLNSNNLLVEDTSKRPVRKKAKRNMRYQVDSDEDPFANVEESDDGRPKRRKKGTRYYSDDEYVPAGEAKQESSEDNFIDEFDSDFDQYRLSFTKQKRKSRKRTDGSSQNRTPKKIPKIQPEVTTLPPTEASDDFEQMLESSIIKSDPSLIKTINPCTPNQEFENFLASRIPGNDLLIKKVSSSEKPALEIPSINPKELPKLVERSSQTTATETSTACIQTSSPYAIKVANNINFTIDQSEKACDFLKNILSTTTELGKLMTEKSEEFMQKKINITHVKDTTKMDYCVKKAFLLFKLAKDNLTTMEETLEKQYEEFMRINDLGSAIATDTKIAPKLVEKDDSDCEIIDDPLPAKSTNSKASNSAAKTVFLNKELSIKIAKKAPTVTAPRISTIPSKPGKNIDVQGNKAVWLNSAIMVKKVKPTNHFLAQDGRNKKPPDSVTNKMVKDFFDQYFRSKAFEICAHFSSPHWLRIQQSEVTCNYFVLSSLDNESSSSNILPPLLREPQQTNDGISPPNSINGNIFMAGNVKPKSLLSLCIKACNKIFKLKTNGLTLHHKDVSSLSNLCLLKITTNFKEKNASNSIASLEDSIDDGTDDDDDLLSFENSLNKIKKGIAEIPALKTLCFNVVSQYFSAPTMEVPSMITISGTYDWNSQASDRDSCFSSDLQRTPSCLSLDQEIETYTYNAKSLQSIVYQYLLHVIYGYSSPATEKSLMSKGSVVSIFEVKTLFRICFQLVSRYINPEPQISEIPAFNGLTIDTINTMSDEAFHYLGANDNYDQYTAEDDYFEEGDYNDAEEIQNEQAEENWMVKAQIKELRLGIVSGIIENTDLCDALESQQEPLITRIKTEIPDEIPDDPIQLTNLKTEPEEHNEMVSIPDDIVTKAEKQDYLENVQNNATTLTNIDADGFESFLRGNKMLQGVSSYLEGGDDNIFSQSAYRVRRQHAPDSDTENDYDMDLLVPHDSEVFDMVKTKGNLLNSSSSDDEKSKTDKKGDKKKKGKTKKQPEPKQTKAAEVSKKNLSKEKPKPQPEPVNEVAILTRRMREKIRTEEKKDESDSDTELDLNKSKSKKDKDEVTTNKSGLIISENDNEIQCNSVDSTAVIGDKQNKFATKKSTRRKDADVEDKFTGFNNEDLTEIEKYKKQLDDVYDKILSEDMPLEEPAACEEASNASDRFSPPLMADEPAEILECEPTMPIFEPKKTRKSKTKVVEKAESSATESAVETGSEDNSSLDRVKLTLTEDIKNQAPSLERPYVERNGWKCYLMDVNDSKLNQIPYIGLEKLPEAFVETYFRYQEINCISKEDVEVDRLANLQSLHRSGKELKPKSKGKTERSSNLSGVTTADVGPNGSDAENFEELVPSDDEGNLHDNEDLPALPLKQSESAMAKSLLMGDQESASDGEGGRIKVKKEAIDHDDLPLSKRKSAKNVKVVDHPKNLVLTADKMMKKELDMLHAPVNLEEDIKYSPTDIKPKKLSSRTNAKRERRKSRGDDSSSEEEKLWVNTKSKLLKRMEKRVQEDASVDDAKRAKIVSEFIERRTDTGIVRVGPKKRLTRVSRKKLLEREKQIRVLSKEFAEGQLVGKGCSVSYSKGRKNIRKVLDKKSLARSTVTANMEEFARKRRLHMKQNRLRELLGYEEDVNVLVINDEVCLEYDFKELQPVVAIHPFFTKVMKAHQYEGVKFMWDACFESLDMIANGSPGGGCILAHCMGLGKTLQVLALLHTVLTHPKVGMHRVLVCCPLSTVLNWVDEIHKWLGPVTNQIKVFELSKLKKTYERAYQLEDWYTGGGIFIVGYELFRSLTTLDPEYDDIRPTIVQKIRMALLDPGPDIVVCDEGHLLKNDSSVLALAMSRVKTKRRIVLTGTPMQNNLREYFCMVNFIKPNLLGTYSEYSNRFENPIMNGQHRDSREEDIRLMKARTHILHKVLEGCLQRQEASVLYPYLPTKHEYTVFIKLSDFQTDLYKHYLENYAKLRLTNKNNILKDFHVLQKIWSHPHVLHGFLTRVRDDKIKKVKEERIEDDLAREELAATEDVKPMDAETGWLLEYLDKGKLLDELEASTKFQVVFNILKECVALGDKLLIFSTSLYTMDSLEYFLKKINNWSLGQEYYRLDGTVPPEVRHKWCREFNAENNHKTKLFLISTRAGSLGLNMTAANRVIILDTSWNPAHDIQSIFRIYRFGQKKDCFIYRLVAMGTMEQKIYERSVTKQAVACRVVDEQQIDRHYNMADLAELYDFSSSGWGISCGVAGSVRDVVLLRAARLGCLHAAHEHDSLLRAARDQDLPEHERAAAWDQFQLEHEHTKVQTGMALALSVFGPQQTTIPNDFGINIPPMPPVPVKIEPTTQNNPILPTPAPAPQGKEKRKKGKKIKTETSVTTEPALNPVAVPPEQVNTNFAQPGITIIPPKGMADPGNVLDRIRQILKNTDFRNAAGVIDAAEISKVISSLVSSEQITVAPPKASTEPSTTVAPPPTNIEPIQEVPKLTVKRGRPKKGSQPTKPIEIETKKAPEVEVNPNISRDGRYRRRAAVVAERNLESVSKDDLTVSSDDDYQPGDNDKSQDYRPDDNDASQDSDFVRDTKAKPTKAAKPKDKEESILLSDDDDQANATSNNSTVIPMHRSLLKNKNFIKIVAHTYLKGNPMLDEDAAMLAAEYSTNKALKEVEITGKDIDSGPIYDIASQVLGLDILKKLLEKDTNKTATAQKGMNSFQKLPIKEEPSETTPTKAKPVEAPKIRIKTENEMRNSTLAIPPNQPSRRKDQLRTRQMFENDDMGSDMDGGLLLTMRSKPAPKEIQPPPKLSTYRPGPSSVKARRSMAGSFQDSVKVQSGPGSTFVPTQLPVPDTSEGVVPIGIFKRTENIGITMPLMDEESILPDDDDDVRISVDPQIRPPPVALPPNITPVILRTNPSQPALEISPLSRRQKGIEKILQPDATITDGTKTIQLKRLTSLPEILTAKKQKFALAAMQQQQQAAVSTNFATISLDSDEEESSPPVAQIRPTHPNAIKTSNVNGKQCIVIPASAFQDILRRVQSTPADPNNLSAPQAKLDVTPSTSKSQSQIKTGDKLFIPANTSGPASKTRAAKAAAVLPTLTPKPSPAPPKPPPAPPKPAVRAKTPPKPVAPKKYPDIALSSSSESERSRSPSPTDPMSILRNVVHIQAGPTPETNPKPAPKPRPAVPSKPTPVPSHSKSTRSLTKQPIPPKQSQPTQKPAQTKLKMALRVSGPAAKIAALASKASAQTSKTSQSKTKDDSSYRLLGSFDLTDLPEVSVVKTPSTAKPGGSTNSAKQRGKIQEVAKTNTITGKSRDIILTPGNKSGVKALAIEASVLDKAAPAKRKPEPVPMSITSAPKKKKPTRLEEFSLDDLEDIIELE